MGILFRNGTVFIANMWLKVKGQFFLKGVLNIHYKSQLICPDLFPPQKESVFENWPVAEILSHHSEEERKDVLPALVPDKTPFTLTACPVDFAFLGDP